VNARVAAIAAAAPRVFARTVESDNGCIYWLGGFSGSGYGTINVPGYGPQYVHRVIAAHRFGDLPDDLTVDHTCHNRSEDCEGHHRCEHRGCVNPDHLELVTQAENQRRACARRTRCINGHDYEPDNLRYGPNGSRICITCVRRSNMLSARRRRAAARAAA
jgi:hypothetical protein